MLALPWVRGFASAAGEAVGEAQGHRRSKPRWMRFCWFISPQWRRSSRLVAASASERSPSCTAASDARSSCQRPLMMSGRSFIGPTPAQAGRRLPILEAFQPVGEGPQGPSIGQIEQRKAVRPALFSSSSMGFALMKRCSNSTVDQSGVGWTSVGGHGALCEPEHGAGFDRWEYSAMLQPRLSPWRSPRLRAAFRPFQPVAAASRASAVKSRRFAVVGLQHKQAKGHRRDSTSIQQGATDGG